MGNVSIWDEHPPTPQLRGLDAILSVTQPLGIDFASSIEIRQKWFLILPLYPWETGMKRFGTGYCNGEW